MKKKLHYRSILFNFWGDILLLRKVQALDKVMFSYSVREDAKKFLVAGPLRGGG